MNDTTLDQLESVLRKAGARSAVIGKGHERWVIAATAPWPKERQNVRRSMFEGREPLVGDLKEVVGGKVVLAWQFGSASGYSKPGWEVVF
jgi:hypothetical protein